MRWAVRDEQNLLVSVVDAVDQEAAMAAFRHLLLERETHSDPVSGWTCEPFPERRTGRTSQFAEAEAAARHAGLLREAAEWTEMLARDGIRFDQQPVMPLYFWLGKDAPA